MTNTFDTDQVASYIEQIEAQEAQSESKRGEYMNFAKQRKKDIAEIFEDAKANGIPKPILKALLGERKLEAKKQKLREGLEDDYREPYVDLAEVLAAAKKNPWVQTTMDLEPADDEEEGEPADPEEVLGT